MAQHDEQIGMESRTWDSMDVVHLMADETYVRMDYMTVGGAYKVLDTERCAQIMHEMTGKLYMVWNVHLASQAGKKNPRYWRGSRTA